MITVCRKGDLVEIFASTTDNPLFKTRLASRLDRPKGPVFGHAANIAFFEQPDGMMKSSNYKIGWADAKERTFQASPDELAKAFEDAQIPLPPIVRMGSSARRTTLLNTLRGFGGALFSSSPR